MDLDEWLRGERDWRTLFDLLGQLPDGAKYPSAVLMDREIAEATLDAEAEDEDPDKRPAPASKNPPLNGYTPLMAKLDDLLEVMIAVQYTLAKQDPRKAPKAPRPKTAYEVVRDERDSVALNSFVSRLLRR